MARRVGQERHAAAAAKLDEAFARGIDDGRAAAEAEFEARLRGAARRVRRRELAAERQEWASRTGEELANRLLGGRARARGAGGGDDGTHPEALCCRPSSHRQAIAELQAEPRRAAGERLAASASASAGPRICWRPCAQQLAGKTATVTYHAERGLRRAHRGRPDRAGDPARGLDGQARGGDAVKAARKTPTPTSSSSSAAAAASEEGGHHGGVWKIAYADFMTAMMAFFLVMWLINSTDKKMLTQVATYFNPMRLTDRRPLARAAAARERGARQAGQAELGRRPKDRQGQGAARRTRGRETPAAKGDGKDEATAAGTARYAEEALFSDPYGVLAQDRRRSADRGPAPAAAKAAAPAARPTAIRSIRPSQRRRSPTSEPPERRKTRRRPRTLRPPPALAARPSRRAGRRNAQGVQGPATRSWRPQRAATRRRRGKEAAASGAR